MKVILHIKYQYVGVFFSFFFFSFFLSLKGSFLKVIASWARSWEKLIEDQIFILTGA